MKHNSFIEKKIFLNVNFARVFWLIASFNTDLCNRIKSLPSRSQKILSFWDISEWKNSDMRSIKKYIALSIRILGDFKRLQNKKIRVKKSFKKSYGRTEMKLWKNRDFSEKLNFYINISCPNMFRICVFLIIILRRNVAQISKLNWSKIFDQKLLIILSLS